MPKITTNEAIIITVGMYFFQWRERTQLAYQRVGPISGYCKIYI